MCVWRASPRAGRTEGSGRTLCLLGVSFTLCHLPLPLPSQLPRARLHLQTLKQAGTSPRRAQGSVETAQGGQQRVSGGPQLMRQRQERSGNRGGGGALSQEEGSRGQMRTERGWACACLHKFQTFWPRRAPPCSKAGNSTILCRVISW